MDLDIPVLNASVSCCSSIQSEQNGTLFLNAIMLDAAALSMIVDDLREQLVPVNEVARTAIKSEYR